MYRPIIDDDLGMLRDAGFGGLPVSQWYVLLNALDAHMKATGMSFPIIWEHINDGDFGAACGALSISLGAYRDGLKIFTYGSSVVPSDVVD
jgi:hypothetical protein